MSYGGAISYDDDDTYGNDTANDTFASDTYATDTYATDTYTSEVYTNNNVFDQNHQQQRDGTMVDNKLVIDSLENSASSRGLDKKKTARMIGAGLAAGVATLALGPVVAIVAGVGVAIGTRHDGVAGDTCRALGDVALFARDKATAVNQQHHVVTTVKDKLGKGLHTVMETTHHRCTQPTNYS